MTGPFPRSKFPLPVLFWFGVPSKQISPFFSPRHLPPRLFPKLVSPLPLSDVEVGLTGSRMVFYRTLFHSGVARPSMSSIAPLPPFWVSSRQGFFSFGRIGLFSGTFLKEPEPSSTGSCSIYHVPAPVALFLFFCAAQKTNHMPLRLLQGFSPPPSPND